MNTVRTCLPATVAFLVFPIGWWAADAVVCCNSGSVASGGKVASCQNDNRTFHTVEAIGGGTCDDNRTALLVRKCCSPGRPYDPELRVCGTAGADGDKYRQRMMHRLVDGFRAVADAVMVGYDYTPPKCDATQVLVDVPAVEVRGLMEAHPSAIELPPGYCFDLTPSDELVARTCRPRDQYCGRDGYTCVNKCCTDGKNYFVDDQFKKHLNCKESEIPFMMSAYETDEDGRPVGRSNRMVLPYYLTLECLFRERLNDGFTLTTNGSLYLKDKDQLVPNTKYCVDSYAEAGSPVATGLRVFMCPIESSFTFFVDQASYIASSVCLALTLVVYAKLSYLRNVHGHYVMCYVACFLVLFVLLIIQMFSPNDLSSPFCIPFGYFHLFAYLTTFCWLNVICFDIYWMLRYNNSINRNTSISVRTIMYHIYCWGFSSICVSTGYLFQHSEHETLLKLAPDIGYHSCSFYDFTGYGIIIFLLLPASVMLTANLILFWITVIHCSRIKSELNKFKQTDDSKIQRFRVEKEKFFMSIKLFLVMGIPFLISTLSVLFQRYGIIWDIFDTASRLQGVFVFIIFVAKRKVIMDLRNKFRGSMDHSESTQINTTISGSS
ncbi:G-protein coupled receptor Mth2-like [Metopolophium dirhodum]|uniref:G-protein coupled receptor Mth2-like n=1 Tax=Metopolophium dirhodum TaxID=44670 RepID=UPI0029901894|nr:G-protein coupled receptor Mth2-like [Metopolophium dirhodum]